MPAIWHARKGGRLQRVLGRFIRERKSGREPTRLTNTCPSATTSRRHQRRCSSPQCSNPGRMPLTLAGLTFATETDQLTPRATDIRTTLDGMS